MPNKYGLIFKNAHSFKDHGLILQSVDRNLLPAVKRQQVDILSIDGKFDLQDETPIYDDRLITARFTYSFRDLPEQRAKARETAQWLSGRSSLIFDDEPDKYYDAKVFEVTAIEQTFHTMAVTVVFECKPYAYGALITLPVTMGANVINYQGNARTPTLIILRCASNINVSNIMITAVVRKTGRGTA